MVAGPSNAALEEIANAEVATDLPYFGGFALYVNAVLRAITKRPSIL